MEDLKTLKGKYLSLANMKLPEQFSIGIQFRNTGVAIDTVNFVWTFGFFGFLVGSLITGKAHYI